MVTTDYSELAKTLRFGPRRISATLGDVSHVTVHRVLSGDKSGMCSTATRARIYAAIDQEAARIKNALNRLSGGATGEA